MSSEHEIILMKIDSYTKTALKKELKYRLRSRNNHLKRVRNFSELNECETQKLKHLDEYEIERFNEIIKTSLFNAVIHDELIYKALISLKRKNLEIIILKYWGGLTDAEIGNKLSISRDMVTYHRNRTLKLLKKLIKEMENLD